MLSERVGLKTTLVEYVFIPRHDISQWFSYTSKYKVLISGKYFLPFLVNQSYQKFRHIWLQDSELKGWLSTYSPTAYPADSRKVFCEVCNNAIIAKQCERKRHNW